MMHLCVRTREGCSSYLQLLHESHDIEHHLRTHHFVLFVEATLQHAVLHTRTREINGDSIKVLLHANDGQSQLQNSMYRKHIEIKFEKSKIF